MSGRMEQQFSWLSQSTRNRSDIYISQSLYDSISSFLRETESDSTLNEECPKESVSDRILNHCFKPYKLRNEYPYYSLKLKPNRFGLPKSRRRIIIAPPMDSVVPSIQKPRPPVPREVEKVQESIAPPETQDSISTEESDLLNMEAWIKERKQLRNLLENSVNLEEWLTEKKPLTQQEENILRKMKKEREEVKIKAELVVRQNVKPEPKIEPVKVTPLIRAPYPPSIITLQNLLHKQKLKLVDLFKKADRSKTMKFKRVDFLRIIQETKVPISKTDLEEIVVFLTISKKGHIITGADLAECQRLWIEHIKENWKQPKQEPLPVARAASITAKGDLIHYSKSSISSQVACPPKISSFHLQVPPINTEPDRRHLTYSEMEIVGKRYKETRRRLKRKTNPLDFAEQCRLVRSGDPIVDSHCLPSSLEGEMGELVDQHRLACHYVYSKCLKLCEKYGIPISERALKRGLLYPGDRLLSCGKDIRKLRQPGGYINNTVYLGKSPDTDKVEERKPKPIKKPVKKQVVAYRWKSFREFKKLTCRHSKRIYPPSEIWNERFLDENLPESLDAFAKKYMERELRRMYHYLNPLTDPNNFWPGHLLDKLYLYLLESNLDRSEVLFSRVSSTRPINPGINVPRRNWPVNNQGYMTLGDPETCKHNYYI